MRIFIYEHITGGGLAGESVDSTLLPEGFAMLSAIVEDFRDIGQEVVTTIDSNLKPMQALLRAHRILEISRREDLETRFTELVAESDAVLIIAPEFENTLYNLTKTVEKAGKLLLGSSSDAIKIAGDKVETHKKALGAHVLIPSGIRVAFSEDVAKIDKICAQIGYPVVFKPIDGVGGAGICIIANNQDIEAGLQTVRKHTKLDAFQAQKLINGLDVSVSAIVSQQNVHPISLNAQLVKLGPPGAISEYRGGYLPIGHSLKEEAFENCKKVLQHIGGFQGYIGLDFVFSYAPFLIEINPRITTSYLGLREVLSPNPAQLILDAAQGKPPKQVSFQGATLYSKVEFQGEFQTLVIPPEFQTRIKLSTPPIPNQGQTSIFIVSKADSIDLAQKTLTNFINAVGLRTISV
jgi:predicted ATP-grasp superfamily ATP-dependent carboligase